MARRPTPPTAADRVTGSVLAAARESASMDLRQVEAATGISKSVLSRIEQGGRACRVPELIALAKVYRVAPTTLIRRITAVAEDTGDD